MSRLLCVDLSGIVHRIWHVSTQNPDPAHTSISSVARVRSLAHGYDYVAICCDSPRSFRKDIASTYKANRPPTQAELRHQLDVARDRLIEDGFACFEADGFEADDVIATIVRRSADEMQPPPAVVIASMDKDLHQLIDDRVSQLYLVDNSMMTAIEVRAKYGIEPQQMRDWLVLVGDSADNVKGVPSVGPKGATKLLQRFGTIYALMRELGKGASALGLTPSVHKVLAESAISMEIDRQLVSLNDQVPIDWQALFIPRDQKANEAFRQSLANEEDPMTDPFDPVTGEVAMSAPESPPPSPSPPAAAPEKPAPQPAIQSAPPPAGPGVAKTIAAIAAGTAIAAGSVTGGTPLESKMPTSEASSLVSPVREPLRLVEAPLVKVEWNMELEPRSLKDAMSLAAHLHASKLFSAYGAPQGVLATILAGRELNIGAMASLRGFHIIDGKPYMSAGLMNALVLRSGKARVFSIIERSNERAVIRAWRKGMDETLLDIAYTIKDAELAGLVKPGSGWEKNPADMCVARCIAIGARLKFADVCFGLYTPEEMGFEVPEDQAA